MSWRTRTKQAMERVARISATTGVVVLGNAYNFVSRTRPRTVRRLAGRCQAKQARETAEQLLRGITRAYDAVPSLTFRLLTAEDVSTGGGGWTFTADNEYKVSCTLYVTAYYSTQSDVGDVLDEILTAGDRPGSPIPFSHTTTPLHGAREVGQWVAVGQTLSWDTSQRGVEEPRPCMRQQSDPPVYRCMREPEDMTVATIRQIHGTVLQLMLNPVEYFRIDKDGTKFTT
ncbi:hypothetical protein [Streptomyces sp. NPDC051677]|uniref:hypothetical protein n=1 Tax=Streptomyces sp. NPDC051677 TaxID=3365669 RepID=UPI0037CD0720